MTERRHSSSAIEHLNDIIQRTKQDRQQIAKMLGTFQRQHHAAVTELKSARTRNAELDKMVTRFTAENDRLNKRCRELEQEVSMMAAAIEVANREIADSDTMLMDAATAVKSNFVASQAGQPRQPDVRVTAPLPSKPETASQQRETPKPARPGAQQPTACLEADGPKAARPEAVVSTQEQAPKQTAVPAMPAAVEQEAPEQRPTQDDLDKSMAALQRMLEEGLGTT